MCVAGGKRCEYADAVSNIRKKTRSKMVKAGAGSYEISEKIEEEVNKFKEANPELVRASMPDKMNFNCTPPKWEVPPALVEMMGDKKQSIKGTASQEENSSFFKALHQRREEWHENLTKEEKGAMGQYAMFSYESINPFLRKKGFAEWAKKNPMLHQTRGLEGYVEESVKPRVREMDSALAKAVAPEQPEKLYRFIRVPVGVSPNDYIKKYFKPGEGFKDKGFLSTTADPEFIAATIMNRDGKRNKRHIVLEILSSSGGSLQPTETPSSGMVQALEAEVLLPRNTGMRILDSGTRSFEFAKDRKELSEHFAMFNRYSSIGKEGDSIKIPVVRLIDESLIREYRRPEPKQPVERKEAPPTRPSPKQENITTKKASFMSKIKGMMSKKVDNSNA